MRPIFSALPLLTLLACGGGGSGASTAPQAVLRVDTASNLSPIAPELFGVNTPWEDLGQGIATSGELVQDRSFRAFGAVNSPWSALAGNGSVAEMASGGDPSPQGGMAYGGCLRIIGGTAPSDLTGAVQALLGPVQAGTTYTLCCSTYAEGPQAPTLFIGLGQASPYLSIASASDTTTVGAWKHHRITLTPSQTVTGALLSLAIQGPGAVRLDEVRFSAAPDGKASIDPLIPARLQTLRMKVLRWPGGTLVDAFDWKASIGSTLTRGETAATGGRLQTPALGLDEFLGLCEALGAEPIVQVNVLAPSSDAADLVRYCNGTATTPMGALRAANGHLAPYGVIHFELGNEPSADYGGGNDGGSAYAALAGPVADAMKAADPGVQLSGAMEASFQEADWLPTTPLLARWNGEAIALAPKLAAIHGHFYSYFDSDPDEATRFRRLMSAGTVLSLTRNKLAGASALPLWITEYHTDLQQSGVIQTARSMDAASGLAVGDELMTLLQGGFAGASAWNLSEPSGFGMLVHPGIWDMRPAGLAQSLLAPFAGETRLTASLDGAGTVGLGAGKGNIPSNLTYAAVTALASRQASGRLRLALLNRSYDQPAQVQLPVSGAATLTWLAPSDLSAANETAIQVQLTGESRTFSSGDALTLPPHSLVRVDF
jgi:hypothetical protein